MFRAQGLGQIPRVLPERCMTVQLLRPVRQRRRRDFPGQGSGRLRRIGASVCKFAPPGRRHRSQLAMPVTSPNTRISAHIRRRLALGTAAAGPAGSRRTGRAAGNPRRRRSASRPCAKRRNCSGSRESADELAAGTFKKIGKFVRGVRHAAAHDAAALDQHDVSAARAGARRSRLAASTVPENPAPTITKVFRILWKFYQAKTARRPCGEGILRLTFGPVRGQIAHSHKSEGQRCNSANSAITPISWFIRSR